MPSPSTILRCPDCGKSYTHRSSLSKHRAQKHPASTNGSVRCHTDNCNYKCYNRQRLREHLVEAHNLPMTERHLEFESHTGFLHWKQQYERDSCSAFVVHRGATTSVLGVKSQVYFCSRDGFFRSKGKGSRAVKAQGSSKIDAHCTACITASVDVDGRVSVTVVDTHYGHEKELAHVRLSATERTEVAQKLSQGVSFDRILDDIRESLSTTLERQHLITRQDIRNIERSLGLQGIRRHSDDATSVDMWVREMRDQGDSNPVLLYKGQGSPCPEELDDLGQDDFVLGIMTPIQKEMLLSFGKHVVCMDSTHGTNAYDFSLVTVLVVDEFGEGFPVAWCISNREDRAVLTGFLQKIRDVVGQLETSWLMTDDAEQFFSAWVSVFTHRPRKLLCTWHVDRAWRGALRSHIPGNTEMQSSVYKTLRCLLEETDEAKFEHLLGRVLADFMEDESTHKFGEYFSLYAERKCQWASCYRKGANINTNMFVEAFHHTLKYIYMKGFTNRRVDKCVSVLIQFVRDRLFDRLIKLEKGKKSHRIKDIDRRHRTSQRMTLEAVTVIGDSKWSVESTDGRSSYVVEQMEASCSSGCQLTCKACAVCVHEFSCSCVDGTVRGTLCKHVHLVCRFKGRLDDEVVEPVVDEDAAVGPQGDVIITEIVGNREPSEPSQRSKESVQKKLKELVDMLGDSSSCVAFDAVYKHIDAAVQLLKASGATPQPFTPVDVHVPPQRVTPQRPRFKSTKKPRSSTRVPLAKPTREEKEQIVNSIEEQDFVISTGNEHSYTRQAVSLPDSVIVMSRKQMKHLEYFVSADCIARVKGGAKVKESDVEAIPDNVPDAVIDIHEEEFPQLEQFVEDDAWLLMLEVMAVKRREWKCHLCTVVKSTWNMVECDNSKCSKWYHWKCCGIKKEPVGKWFCNFCKG